MPAIRTFATPVNDTLTVSIPKEYQSYSFKIVLFPVRGGEAAAANNDVLPAWAGLCEDAITKNRFGPHDMESIRESVASAERVSAL